MLIHLISLPTALLPLSIPQPNPRTKQTYLLEHDSAHDLAHDLAHDSERDLELRKHYHLHRTLHQQQFPFSDSSFSAFILWYHEFFHPFA